MKTIVMSLLLSLGASGLAASSRATSDLIEHLLLDSYGGSEGRDASDPKIACYYVVETTGDKNYKVRFEGDPKTPTFGVYPGEGWTLGQNLLTFDFKNADQHWKMWYNPKNHWIAKTEWTLRGKTTTCKFAGEEF